MQSSGRDFHPLFIFYLPKASSSVRYSEKLHHDTLTLTAPKGSKQGCLTVHGLLSQGLVGKESHSKVKTSRMLDQF